MSAAQIAEIASESAEKGPRKEVPPHKPPIVLEGSESEGEDYIDSEDPFQTIQYVQENEDVPASESSIFDRKE